MFTYISVGFVMLLGLAGVIYRQMRPGKPAEKLEEVEPEYLRQVRELAESERYKEAAELQMHHGNMQEAYNLFMRGKCHSDASVLAESMNWLDKAAWHAEQAAEFERAASIYERCKKHKMAGRMYAQAGQIQQAIHILTTLPDGPPDDLPEIWEQALIHLLGSLPTPPATISPATQHTIDQVAELASDAYREAGNIERSFLIHSMVEKEQQARRRAANKATGGEKREAHKEREIFPTPEPGAVDPSALFPQHLPQAPIATPLAGSILGPMVATQPPPPMGEPMTQATATPVMQPAGVPVLQPAGAPMVVHGPQHMPTQPVIVSQGGQPITVTLKGSQQSVPVLGGMGVPFIAGVGPAAVTSPVGMVPAGGVPRQLAPTGNDRMHEIMGSHESQMSHSPALSAALSMGAPVIYVVDAYTQMPQAVRQNSERYTLGPKIATGGMAVVYEAMDNKENRKVAIKFLPPSLSASDQALEMFAREAKIASSLHHPNIVAVYDYGVLDSCPYICMELLDGITLQELIQRRWKHGLPLDDIFAISDELLAALDYAHRANLVHRDIKPSNIMCTRDGVIKLMDFGVARQMDTSGSVTVAGTPSYMSPEQVRGRGVDHRTDLFSFGVTLYLLLTGEMPFEGFMRDTTPPSPMEYRDMPEALAHVVMWCMSFMTEDRPESAAVLQKIMQQIYLDAHDDWLEGSEPEFTFQQDTFSAESNLGRPATVDDEVSSLEIETPWDQGETSFGTGAEESVPPWENDLMSSSMTVNSTALRHESRQAPSSYEQSPMELVRPVTLLEQGPDSFETAPRPKPPTGEPSLDLGPKQDDTFSSNTSPANASSDSLEQLLAGYLTEE